MTLEHTPEARTQRLDELIEDYIYPSNLKPLDRNLIRTALHALPLETPLEVSKKPAEITPAEAANRMEMIGESLRLIESSRRSIAMNATWFLQFKEIFPDKYDAYPDDLKARIETLITFLDFDPTSEDFEAFLEKVAKFHDKDAEGKS